MSYNVPGLKTGLKLDGPTISEIFMGKIKTWNASKIAALNPGMTLPSTPITIIHRSDSSGTTAGFTAFLAATDPEWASKVGEGKTVQWPVGTGAKGNAGVAGAVAQTSAPSATSSRPTRCSTNSPTRRSRTRPVTSSRPARIDERGGRRHHGAGQPRSKSQTCRAKRPTPITSQTFIVVNKDLCKAGIPGGEAAAKGVARFLNYGLGEGQRSSARPTCALPSEILSKSKEAASSLQCNGTALRRLEQARIAE